MSDSLAQMTPKERVKVMVDGLAQEFKEAVHGRGNLPREDLEYLMSKVAGLRDERLKQCVAELIGWGDEQRARLETAAAILIEVARDVNPSKFKEAATKVELRYHIRSVK